MPQAIVFDLDGTLLDTLDDLAASTNAALDAHGLPARNVDEIRRFVGNGYLRLIRLAVPADSDETVVRRVHEDFQRHYAKHAMDATAPYPGIVDLLRSLSDAGVARAVVSNKGDEAVKALCRHFFGGLVDVAVGERDGIRRKPAPDSTLAVMDALDAKPRDCVYVGDSEVDLATARNAGVPCVCVTWGFRAEDALRAAGATTVAHSCDELLPLLLDADRPHPARDAAYGRIRVREAT